MDERSEELLGERSNVKNFEPSLEIEISEKFKTLYFERGNHVKSGIR
jgi:hypothetical protein